MTKPRTMKWVKGPRKEGLSWSPRERPLLPGGSGRKWGPGGPSQGEPPADPRAGLSFLCTRPNMTGHRTDVASPLVRSRLSLSDSLDKRSEGSSWAGTAVSTGEGPIIRAWFVMSRKLGWFSGVGGGGNSWIFLGVVSPAFMTKREDV